MSKLKTPVFTGSATALVTPFKDGEIDFAALGRNIEFQIESGSDALVACGTTGEASTLSEKERLTCIEFVVNKTAGRVPVIAGTGSNDTARAAMMSRLASERGADALLTVTPYYNKATRKGLVKSFTEIADASAKPVILYDVPSRTGVDLDIGVLAELARHPNIVAVKDASGNVGETSRKIAELGDELDFYCGNDNIILPMLSIGSAGVISVMSNIIPREVHDICRSFFDGKIGESAALAARFASLSHALFVEVNPIPIKCAMAKLGLCGEEYRLPLCEPEEESRALIYSALRNVGLI